MLSVKLRHKQLDFEGGGPQDGIKLHHVSRKVVKETRNIFQQDSLEKLGDETKRGNMCPHYLLTRRLIEVKRMTH